MPLDGPISARNVQDEAKPLTAFTHSINHVKGIQMSVVFERMTKAFPCCEHVIVVRDLKPKRVTDMTTLEITTQNQKGERQTFICKIPARPELWSNVKNSIALREKLDSPMVPKLYRVISVKGMFEDDPELSMPVMLEENIPHETTVKTDRGHLLNNPAQYIDSFVINSLQLFRQAAEAGYAMIDNTDKNIAVLENQERPDAVEFVYFDLGSIEPLIKKPHPESRSTNSCKTTLQRFLVILENFQKQVVENDNGELAKQLEAFIIYLKTYLESMPEQSDTAEKAVIRMHQKKPITKEQITDDLETIMRTYGEMRRATPGPNLHITPPTPRNTKTPKGLPGLPMRVIRKGIQGVLGM